MYILGTIPHICFFLFIRYSNLFVLFVLNQKLSGIVKHINVDQSIQNHFQISDMNALLKVTNELCDLLVFVDTHLTHYSFYFIFLNRLI